MNTWDFSFETAPWERALNALEEGTSLSASAFLTMMEGETEESLEDAIELLQSRDILLDVSDLPKPPSGGEAAVRLRREEQLAKRGTLLRDLEENDPLRLYLEELASIPVCGNPQLLAQECLEGKDGAARRLADMLLGSVVEQAYEMTGKGVLLLDLIQEGSLGLWQAILNYSGGDIEPYCRRWVQRVLAVTVVLQARENGVGQKMRQALEDYRAVDERLLSDLGRNPTLEEIAMEMHISPEEAALVANMLEAARSMHKTRAEETSEELSADEELAVEDTAYFQTRQRISELLSGLNAQDRQLLTLRFGLEGGLPLSPQDTGKRLGLTPEEVVAREAAALTRLRNDG